MDELISIVIPIYNVEKYLKNCVDSVCNQTYRNLEIILVDDGSPDHCPEICEDYARNDSRVRVIHKQNGGLSDARNYGIEVAKGKYITCIDSDDYVSEDFIEYLYKLLKDANADISVCGFIKTKNLNENRIFTSEDTIEMSSNQAIQEMLYAKIFTTSAWENYTELICFMMLHIHSENTLKICIQHLSFLIRLIRSCTVTRCAIIICIDQIVY